MYVIGTIIGIYVINMVCTKSLKRSTNSTNLPEVFLDFWEFPEFESSETFGNF